MSSIVSRSPPFFGSVSSSKERRWISIRWGTSRGFCSREKLLRVTGAAFERAKTGDSSEGQRDVRYSADIGQGTELSATAKNNTRPRSAASLAPCLGFQPRMMRDLFELDGGASLLEFGLELI